MHTQLPSLSSNPSLYNNIGAVLDAVRTDNTELPIPRAITITLKLFEKMRHISVRFSHHTARERHPYLFIAGLLLEDQGGQDSVFLHSLTHITALTRLFHESLARYIHLQQVIHKLFQEILRPIPFTSIGYMHAFQNRVSWHVLQGRVPTSFLFPNACFALLLRRIELVWDLCKQCGIACGAWLWKMLELKDVLYNKIDAVPVRDFWIELYELYKQYDVSNPNALIAKLTDMRSQLDTTFRVLSIPISTHAIVQKITATFQRIHRAETWANQHIPRGIELVRDIAHVPVSLFHLEKEKSLPFHHD